jgi:hypothetical protein
MSTAYQLSAVSDIANSRSSQGPDTLQLSFARSNVRNANDKTGRIRIMRFSVGQKYECKADRRTAIVLATRNNDNEGLLRVSDGATEWLAWEVFFRVDKWKPIKHTEFH